MSQGLYCSLRQGMTCTLTSPWQLNLQPLHAMSNACNRGLQPALHIPACGHSACCTTTATIVASLKSGYGIFAAGRDTTNFSTEDASGSTSQAANIQEALEAGSQLLLLDEDTCATNFMIRDKRMQVSLPHAGFQPAEHLWRHPHWWDSRVILWPV